MTPDAAAPATDPPTCQATRYGAGPCTPDGPRFDVVYTASDGTELDRHPACFATPSQKPTGTTRPQASPVAT